MIVENEQKGSKQSFFQLEVCCRLIGEKLGNANLSSWTNRDYLKLSSVLSRETSVQISASTLKRLFGKLKTPERYFPQRATRDAMAKFAGFKSWDDFVLMMPLPEPGETQEVPQLVPPAPEVLVTRKPIRFGAYLLSGILLVAFISLGLYIFSRKSDPTPVDLTNVQLICPKPEGENPHSATFRLQLPETFNGDASAFTLHFGDGRKAKSISPSQVLTHYYEVPGRFYVVLKYNDVPVDTLPVYLRTSGWTATASMERDTVRVYPVDSDLLQRTAHLGVSAMDLYHSGVDTNRTFFVSFINAKPLDISGDNFELQTALTTSELRPGVRCSQVTLELLGQKAAHSVMLIKPGCVSWAYLRFLELYLDGETADLSALGSDLTGGGKILLRIADRTVSLFIQGKLAYQTRYDRPIGELYGLKISFSGIGAVKNLNLLDLKTGKRFYDDFAIQPAVITR